LRIALLRRVIKTKFQAVFASRPKYSWWSNNNCDVTDS